MATQTAFPTVFTGSGAQWTNTSNLGADDGTEATLTLPADGDVLLFAKGFGFSIPGGATINGVRLDWQHYKFSGTGTVPPENGAQQFLTKDGATGAGTGISGSTGWTIGESWGIGPPGVIDTMGMGALIPTPMWGTTLTAAEINAATFGVIIRTWDLDSRSSVGKVDYVKLTVDYTAAGGGDAPKQTLLGVG